MVDTVSIIAINTPRLECLAMCKRNYKKWTDEEILFLRKNSDIYTVQMLGEKLERNESSVQNKLTKLKIKKKRLAHTTYLYNREFFQNIDVEEKSYWLGFVAADGCILGGGRTGKRLKISLHKDEKKHLEKFVKSLDGNIDIKDYKYKTKDGFYEHVEISVGSNKLCNDLEKLNITKAKSKTLRMSEIRDDLIRHYLRAYIDGDGHYYLSKDGKKSYIEIYVGSKELLDFFRSYLESNGIDNYIFHYQNKNIYKISVHNKNSKLTLIRLLYKDATIFLDRKKEKALKIYQTLSGYKHYRADI
ncbi:LAGLIDADG family homing endonuclease [Guptibacillus hwajinpoensis]|uniref:LAGLIDADG family homing endonuclease n=1 Tax=Guptibacillus hwajinpoensis TaxID=208199 RepID=UPI003735CC44